MHHIAIMKKSWGLIPKILSGEKTIESRWYQTKRIPWNRIREGDRVYFKNSGESVSIVAIISNVMQFEIKSIADAHRVIKKYGAQICMINKNPKTWTTLPRYCILITLKQPKKIVPFAIAKKGFGSAAAWLRVASIDQIKLIK